MEGFGRVMEYIGKAIAIAAMWGCVGYCVKVSADKGHDPDFMAFILGACALMATLFVF